MVKIDLHSHSTRSDGLDTPSQLVANAAKAKIDVLALTDHDTVSGWDEARSAAIKLGLGFVPGIEVTSVSDIERFGRTIRISVHLLAYLKIRQDTPALYCKILQILVFCSKMQFLRMVISPQSRTLWYIML